MSITLHPFLRRLYQVRGPQGTVALHGPDVLLAVRQVLVAERQQEGVRGARVVHVLSRASKGGEIPSKPFRKALKAFGKLFQNSFKALSKPLELFKSSPKSEIKAEEAHVRLPPAPRQNSARAKAPLQGLSLAAGW